MRDTHSLWVGERWRSLSVHSDRATTAHDHCDLPVAVVSAAIGTAPALPTYQNPPLRRGAGGQHGATSATDRQLLAGVGQRKRATIYLRRAAGRRLGDRLGTPGREISRPPKLCLSPCLPLTKPRLLCKLNHQFTPALS